MKILFDREKICAIDIYLPGSVEIQVVRSAFAPSCFWYTKYVGVARVKSDSFHADNWMKAHNFVIAQ